MTLTVKSTRPLTARNRRNRKRTSPPQTHRNLFGKRKRRNIETQLTDFPLGAFDDACDGLKLLVTAFEKMGGSH